MRAAAASASRRRVAASVALSAVLLLLVVMLMLMLMIIAPTVSASEEKHDVETPSVAPPMPHSINNEMMARIINGQPVPSGSYPWIAALLRGSSGNYFQRQYCGGSLIAPNYVLTAAHCVSSYTASQVSVLVGCTSLSACSRSPVPVSAILSHPAYQASSYTNDMALLRLSSPILDVTPVKLVNSTLVTTYCSCFPAYVAGWGTIASGTNSYPVDMYEAYTPIVSQTTCVSDYSSVSPITSAHVCAGSPTLGTDSCQGDSGGPLFVNLDTSGYFQVGVVSFGVGCGQVEYPGVYTRLLRYTTAINMVLNGSSTTLPAIYDSDVLPSSTQCAAQTFATPSCTADPGGGAGVMISTWAIVGIVVGVIFLIVFIVLIARFCVLMRRRRTAGPGAPARTGGQTLGRGPRPSGPQALGAEVAMRPVSVFTASAGVPAGYGNPMYAPQAQVTFSQGSGPMQPYAPQQPYVAQPYIAQPYIAQPYTPQQGGGSTPMTQPAYGQPAYSQGQPVYSQAPPAYGQAPPAYGQAPLAYGQAPPAYGQMPPAYGLPPPPQVAQAPGAGSALSQSPQAHDERNPFLGQ